MTFKFFSVVATALIASLAGAAEPTVSLNVVYPNHEGAKFDTIYYRDKHIPLCMTVMKPTSVTLTVGLPNGDNAAPFAMIAHFEFASAEAMKAALGSPAMADLRADLPNFTDIKPIVMQGKSL